MAQKKLLLAGILVLALLVTPQADAITIYVRDINTGNLLNATLTLNYNIYQTYQEYANSTNTSRTNTTSKPVLNGSGDYYVVNSDPYFYINYSKTVRSLNATWEVRAGITGLGTDRINITIPNQCYNAYSDKLVLRIYSKSGNNTKECYNSTAWVILNSTAAGTSGSTPTYNASANLYDGDYSSASKYVENYIVGNYTGWLTDSATSDNGRIFEEGIWWGINTSTETTSGTTGIISPEGQVNYTTANITASAEGYVNVTINNINLLSSTYTFNLTQNNNVTFYFYDESTNTLVTANTTIQLSSSVAGYNSSTTNGSLTIANITYGYYTITYSAANYSVRSYFAYLPAASSATYTLYLLPDTLATAVRFTVLDQSYAVLEGAVINSLRKNLSGTNYYNVGSCTTDSNGECIIYLQTLTATYRFLTQYQSVVRNTSDTVLSRDTYTIILNTASSTLQNVLGRDDISASLVYTPTGRFDYTVLDSNGNVQSGLLTIERRYGGRLYSVSSTTASGSTFVITATGVNVSLGDEIVAKGYVYVGNQSILTHSISVIDSTAGGALNSGLAFLFLGMLFTIVFIFAWNPVAPLVGFGAFLIIMSRIGIIGIGMGAVVAILVVLAVAIYRMRSV